MARGQERTVTGGQIDPYVQQSMQQNKSLAENRLISAMQQGAATQRQREATTAQAQTAEAQMQNTREMQAAESAAADRRNAEAIRAQREDLEYRKTMGKAQLALTREIESNRLEWEKAKYNKDLESAEEAREVEFELHKLDSLLRAREAYNTNNFNVTLLKTLQQKQAAEEGFVTLNGQRSIDADTEQNVFGTDKQAAYEATRDSLFVGATKRETENMAVDAAQKQMTMMQSKLNMEDLRAGNISKLETKLVSGYLDFTDLSRARAAIEGVMQVTDEKIKEYKGKKMDTPIQFYEWQRNELAELLGNLKGLVHNHRRLLADETQKISDIANQAFGYIDGTRGGNVAQELRALGYSNREMYDEMSKGIDPVAPLTFSEGTFKKDKVIGIVNDINNILTGRGEEPKEKETPEITMLNKE